MSVTVVYRPTTSGVIGGIKPPLLPPAKTKYPQRRKIAMLTDVKARNAKPGEKQTKLFDGGGLFLLVTPQGGKSWRLKYRIEGKEKLLSFGTYQ
jgi:Arm DNA-binding domain